jgi:leucyl-tRNA synthetase
MHKSKGNFVTMKNAIDKYGADSTRCALLMGAEGMDDPDWRSGNVRDIQDKLGSFYNFAMATIDNAKKDENTRLERWLMSTLQRRISEVTENLEQMKTRTALETAFFEIWNDFRWYARRKGKMDAKMLREALEIWLKLLAPFAPHICEELWSQIHRKSFISLAAWPQTKEENRDTVAEEQEAFIKEAIEDTLNVLKATKITPKKICYYTASQWKWRVYLKVLERSIRGEAKINELMKGLAVDKGSNKHLGEIAKFIPKMMKEAHEMPSERKHALLNIGQFDEKATITSATDFLAERFKAQIVVYNEEDKKRYDPRQRAAMSMPYRPAIYLE